jgi:SAM-dependent methyltransferase
MTDAYRDDLAYIHDAGFGGLARAAAPVLLDALKRAGISQGVVIDLGCGSGILSRAVSAAGFNVLGIDISRAMVALASASVPRGHFRVESLLTVELPRCVAVAAVGESLNYMFDSDNTTASLNRLFRRIYAALEPGGLLLFDVAAPGRVTRKSPRRLFVEGDDWAVLVTADENRDRLLLTRSITTFRKVGDLYRRDHEVHVQRLLARPKLAAQLRTIGFKVRSLRGYGQQRFGRGHDGFLARRP